MKNAAVSTMLSGVTKPSPDTTKLVLEAPEPARKKERGPATWADYMSGKHDQRYKEIVRALFDLTKMINSPQVGERDALSHIAEETAKLLRADSCSIFLIEEGTSTLLSHGTYGLSAQDQAGATFARGEGVAGWVAQHGQSARIDDVSKDKRYIHLPQQNIAIRSLLAIPLSVRAQVLGVMTVTSDRLWAFTREDEELLTFLGNQIVRDFENARLYQLAITDPLTRVHNRQYLLHRLPGELERCRRYGDAFSLILFDVDYFKHVNDAYGHAGGDFLLRELARTVKADMRESDGIVRYGGEEFLLLLPKTDINGAAAIAERLRADVERRKFTYLDKMIGVTVSLGVGQYRPVETEQEFVRRIDQALYAAKSGGRNRAMIDREESPGGAMPPEQRA